MNDKNAPPMQPTIVSLGYIVELAGDGPWLMRDGTWTPTWGERGVWYEIADAEMALALSLEQKIKP